MKQNIGTKHFYWLDLIRFLAALSVVLVHARGEVWETYSLLEPESRNIGTMLLYAIFSQGYTGVIVFFVLSGFLVGGRNIARICDGTSDFRKYVIDRSVRIGLPLVGSIILIIFVNSILGVDSDYLMLAGNMFALQGIFVGDAGGVFWTLSYEMWFYVLIGGCILLFGKKNNIAWAGVAVICVSLCAFTALNTFWLLVLTMGVLAYYLINVHRQPNNKLLIFSVCLFVVAIALNMLSSDSKAFDKSFFKFINVDVTSFIIGVSSALIISDVAWRIPTTAISRWVNRVGTKLAIFSYSLYLTHWQVLRIVNHYFGRSTVINGYAICKFAVTVLACIVFAYLFYLLTERNTDRVKKWFFKR